MKERLCPTCELTVISSCGANKCPIPAEKSEPVAQSNTLGDMLKESGLDAYIKDDDVAHAMAVAKFASMVRRKAAQTAPVVPEGWCASLALIVERLNDDAEMYDSLGQNSTAEDRRARAYEISLMLSAAPSAPAAEPVQQLDHIEQYRLQMAAISTAALGYWKIGDPIKDEYVTVALKDVAKLYEKYDELFKAAQSAPAPSEDAKRLDWLEAQGDPNLSWLARHSVTGRGYRLHQSPHAGFATPREAIDAAMSATAQQKEGE